MKFRSTFLILVAVLHGYLLWTQLRVAPFWIKRAEPATDAEITVRWIFLVAIIAAVLVVNSVVSKRRDRRSWYDILAPTVYSFSFLYLPIIGLSESLDIYFLTDTTISDALGFYRNNPLAFPFEFTLLNLVALAIATVVLVILRNLELIMARFGRKNR